RVRSAEQNLRVGEQPNTEAHLSLGGTTQLDACSARGLWPMPSSSVGNREQRLPALGRTIGDPIRQIWPGRPNPLPNLRCPPRHPIAPRVSNGLLEARAERIDAFPGCTAPHSDNDRSSHDRFGKV